MPMRPDPPDMGWEARIYRRGVGVEEEEGGGRKWIMASGW